MNWNLESYFPAFNGPEMVAFKEQLQIDAAELLDRASALDTLNRENADDWEAVFLTDEELTTRISHLGSYLGCLTAADAANEDYKKEEAAFARAEAEYTKINVELLRGLKDSTDDDFAALSEGGI